MGIVYPFEVVKLMRFTFVIMCTYFNLHNLVTDVGSELSKLHYIYASPETPQNGRKKY